MAAQTEQSVTEEAREWLLEHVPGASLDQSDSERLNICTPSGKFYIIPPGGPTEEWTVWSDDTDTAYKLSSNLDCFNSDTSVTQLLTKTIKCLQSTTDDTVDSEGTSSSGSEQEEEEDMYDDYYNMEEEDRDAETEETVREKSKSDEEEVSADDFFTGDGSAAAVHRLLADLKNMSKSNGKFGISGQPRRDNLFLWDVELSDFDPKSLLHKDLTEYAKRFNKKPVIEVEMKFPRDYPMNPPFVRILRPRFQFLTGHVTIGGSICMQMLTRSGWSPSNDIESILVQVRAEIMSDPNARLDLHNSTSSYSESEARQAFERMVHRYGWNK